MRVTLNLDDDALIEAKGFASRQGLSLGQAVSRLVREAAQQPIDAGKAHVAMRGRFALLPARDEIVTLDHVRALIEREGH
jgi:hypothetical protein